MMRRIVSSRLIGPLLAMGFSLVGYSTASGQSPATSAVQTPGSQYFVLSFKDTPVAEVGEAVIGGALGQSVSVDPAISGDMTFQADGWFTPDALLAEFGAAAMDREIALVRSRQGDLALVSRDNLAPELARGATVVAGGVMAPAAARPVQSSTPAPKPIVYGKDRWQEGRIGAILLFVAGVLSGAAGLFGLQTFNRRRPQVQPQARRLMIDHQSAAKASTPSDDDLVIPAFDASMRRDRP